MIVQIGYEGVDAIEVFMFCSCLFFSSFFYFILLNNLRDSTPIMHTDCNAQFPELKISCCIVSSALHRNDHRASPQPKFSARDSNYSIVQFNYSIGNVSLAAPHAHFNYAPLAVATTISLWCAYISKQAEEEERSKKCTENRVVNNVVRIV